MAKTSVITLDLNFQGKAQAIAAYLIRHPEGPSSSRAARAARRRPSKRAGSQRASVSDVTHVLLTHIHLDHAGAAGWLAKPGRADLRPPVGAPHLLNPEKLLASAARIYGDKMSTLWGDFLPVPEAQLHVAQDGEEIAIGNLALPSDQHARPRRASLRLSLRGRLFHGRRRRRAHPRLPVSARPHAAAGAAFGKWRESIARFAARSSPASPPPTSASTTIRMAANRRGERSGCCRALAGNSHAARTRRWRLCASQFTDWMAEQGAAAGPQRRCRPRLRAGEPSRACPPTDCYATGGKCGWRLKIRLTGSHMSHASHDS